MPAETSAGQLLIEKQEGRARTGVVTLRDFDQGVVETLYPTDPPKIVDGNYYLDVIGVAPPQGYPGIPVVFGFPEDVFELKRLPLIEVRRDDMSTALQRWHPGLLQYRTPAEGALISSYSEGYYQKTGFNKMEQAPQADPFDLHYTLSIFARLRGQQNQANKILDHVLRVYRAYSLIYVKDSLGDIRTYDVFMEGVSMLDDVPQVTERVIGFSISLRVEAEYDLEAPIVQPTVSSRILRGRPL